MIRTQFFGLLRVIWLVPVILGTAFSASAQETRSEGTANIFFSAGCADCWPFTQEVLIPAVKAEVPGLDTEIHDYTVPGGRKRLLEFADAVQLPRSINDSLYAFIPTDRMTLVILGHVPSELIRAALAFPERPERLVIWQPKMHGTPTEYRLWAWTGSVTTFPIDTPFPYALAQALESSGPFPVGHTQPQELLTMVILTGLLDSLNPCAFAVILLLLAFLFTLRKSRGHILMLGSVYILMIFLVYFAIGLGILQSVRLSDDPHFMARLGAWLLIVLGVINLIEYKFPKFPIKLHMPAFAGARSKELIKKATLPATVAAGILVGLCTFPCSGGIYVSVITLLNAKATMAWGIGYLALYNIMFVLPLIVILLATSNRVTAKAWANWERGHTLNIRLWYGLAMVGLGAVFLIWFID